MDLILEVSGRRADLLGQRDDTTRFRKVARKWFLADQSSQSSAFAHCVGDAFHHLDAAEVGVEDRDDVDMMGHLPHTFEHTRLTQTACSYRLGQLVRRRTRREPGNVDAADSFERPEVELADEPRADDSVTQTFHFRLVSVVVRVLGQADG